MGFFDVLKGIGRDILDSAKERQEKILYYKEMYNELDDQSLMRKYKQPPNSEARLAAGMLLKERGYGQQNDE